MLENTGGANGLLVHLYTNVDMYVAYAHINETPTDRSAVFTKFIHIA